VPATAILLTEEGRDVEVVVEVEIVIAADLEDVAPELGATPRSGEVVFGAVGCRRTRGGPCGCLVRRRT
jgi:hypothetical protein